MKGAQHIADLSYLGWYILSYLHSSYLAKCALNRKRLILRGVILHEKMDELDMRSRILRNLYGNPGCKLSMRATPDRNQYAANIAPAVTPYDRDITGRIFYYLINRDPEYLIWALWLSAPIKKYQVRLLLPGFINNLLPDLSWYPYDRFDLHIIKSVLRDYSFQDLPVISCGNCCMT